MAPAVTTVLTAVLGQSTAWDDFEDPWFAGLQSEMEARPLAGIGPHSRQNSWQPQVTGAPQQATSSHRCCFGLFAQAELAKQLVEQLVLVAVTGDLA